MYRRVPATVLVLTRQPRLEGPETRGQVATPNTPAQDKYGWSACLDLLRES